MPSIEAKLNPESDMNKSDLFQAVLRLYAGVYPQRHNHQMAFNPSWIRRICGNENGSVASASIGSLDFPEVDEMFHHTGPLSDANTDAESDNSGSLDFPEVDEMFHHTGPLSDADIDAESDDSGSLDCPEVDESFHHTGPLSDAETDLDVVLGVPEAKPSQNVEAANHAGSAIGGEDMDSGLLPMPEHVVW